MSLEHYRKAIEDNAIAFEVNCAEQSNLFDAFDAELAAIIGHLNSRLKLLEVHQRIASTFLVIIHRQFRSGFEHYRRRQSVDGDTVMRIAIECACHYHKIFQHPELVVVFANNLDNPKSFKDSFPDRQLFAETFLHSARLKGIRDNINSSGSHPDLLYISQAIETMDRKWNIHYFDHDNDIYLKKLWQYLDCYWRCIDSIRSILKNNELLPLSMNNQSGSWNKYSRMMQDYTDKLREITPKPLKIKHK